MLYILYSIVAIVIVEWDNRLCISLSFTSHLINTEINTFENELFDHGQPLVAIFWA